MAIRHLKREGQPHWDALRERFLREARTLQVRHPNLLHVRDFGEDATGVFVVTDLVAGPSLRDRLAAGPLAWPLARQLILQMVDAAAALHANGGLLTGVNPDTIRVTGAGGDEQLVLSSGGIRALGDVLSTMREPQLRGQESSELELPFIAPEVLTGRAPDPRADVFTVGAIAVYLVTARPPFEAPSLPELIGQMLQPGSPVSLPDVVPPVATSACAAVWPPIPPSAARSPICARRWPERASRSVDRGSGGADQRRLIVQNHVHRHRREQPVHRRLGEERPQECALLERRQDLRRDATADIEPGRGDRAQPQVAGLSAVGVHEHRQRPAALRALSGRGRDSGGAVDWSRRSRQSSGTSRRRG